MTTDPAALRHELATCERRACKVEDAEAAGRWRRRARDIETVIKRCEAEGTKNRARDADWSWVKPIMPGCKDEGVIDN